MITTLLMERREREVHPIRTFYLRRVLRLVPAVVALLAANFLYALARGVSVDDALRSVAVVLRYVTNWAELAGISISPYVTHLWSLGIEKQFYLVWPVLLFGGLRLWNSRRKLMVLERTIGALAAVWAVAVAAAVLLACSLDPDNALSWSLARGPLVLLGKLSYSLYLWHFGIFQILAAHTPTWSAAVHVPVGIGLALLAAAASYWLVERPALRLKGRLGRPVRAGA